MVAVSLVPLHDEDDDIDDPDPDDDDDDRKTVATRKQTAITATTMVWLACRSLNLI